MAISRERERDRAARHTEIYAKHLADAVAKGGGPQAGRLITTAEELEANMVYWDRRGHGQAYLVTPEQGFEVRTLFTFMGQMGPKTKTEVHRHMNEAVIHILEGAGYTVFDVDGQRVEWKKGDTLCIPQWAWHQHVNPNEGRARYLATINRPLMESLGLFKIEDYAGD